MVAVMAIGFMDCTSTTTSSSCRYSYNDARVITDEGYCTPIPKQPLVFVARPEPKPEKDTKKYSFRLNQLLYNLQRLPFKRPKNRIKYYTTRLPEKSSLVRPKERRWTVVLSRRC
jgi:hypothetical protein